MTARDKMMTKRTDPYTTKEMAELCRCNEVTLRTWRHRGKGPPWYYANGQSGKVLYDAESYRKWRDDQEKKSKNKKTTSTR